MVNLCGETLLRQRRTGWEEAYIDYAALKAVLVSIEDVWTHASMSSQLDGDDEVLEDLDPYRGAELAASGLQKTGDWITSYANPAKETRDEECFGCGVGQSCARGCANFFTNATQMGTPRRPQLPLYSSPSYHLANSKVMHLADRFVGLLQSEIEKVSLFALSRLGELSDTVGSLRFGDSKMLSNSLELGRSRNNSYSSGDESDSSNDSGYNSNYDIRSSSREQISALPRRQTSQPSTSYHRHHLQNNPSSSFYFSSAPNLNQRRMFTDHFLGEESILVPAVDEIDAYVQVGTEVLHLLRFICVNAMIASKVLKKHDKLLSNKMMGGYYDRLRGGQPESSSSSGDPQEDVARHPDDGQSPHPQRVRSRLAGGADAHLRALCNGAAISAISASLISALSEFETAHSRAEEINRATDTGRSMYHSLKPAVMLANTPTRQNSADCLSPATDQPSFQTQNVPIQRLRNCVSSIQTVRNAADVAYSPFEAFLSRKAFTVTGSRLGDLGGSSLDVLSFILKYDPSTAPFQQAKFFPSTDGKKQYKRTSSDLTGSRQSTMNECINLGEYSLSSLTLSFFVLCVALFCCCRP